MQEQTQALQPVERLAAESAELTEQALALADQAAAWVQANGFSVGLAAVSAFLIFLGFRLLRSTLYAATHRSKQPETAWPNIVARVIKETKSLFMMIFAAAIVVPLFIRLNGGQAVWFERVFTVVLALQAAFWARVVALALLERMADKHTAATGTDENSLANALGLLTVFANILVFAVALIFIIDNLGGDVTALIAGLGVGGIAIGLAAQSLFEDLFAGLSIILDKPFVRGDFIIFGDKLGTVQKVGLKSTRITTLQGQQLVVNNSKLLGYEINNYRRMTERRVVIKIGVTYQTPREKLGMIPDAIKQIVQETRRVRFDRCHMAGYGDFAILFELVFWVQDRDYTVFMDVQQSVLLDIHELFELNGVEFAYPTQTLHVETVPEGLYPPKGARA